MDIMKAVTFIPEEDRWIEKLAIGVGVILVSSVLSVILIGVLGFFILIGYAIRLMQNVRDGVQPVLPEWNEWGGDLTRGFKYAVVGFVWGLGILLLSIPTFLGAIMTGGDNSFIQGIGTLIMGVGLCLSILYGIFILLAQPGFTIAFAEDERISSGLALSKIWNWTMANLGQVIIVAISIFIGSFIISSLAGIVGLLLCGVGLLVTTPLAMLITYIFQFHLFGQLAREFPMDGSRPAPAPAPAPSDAPSEPTGLIETEQAPAVEDGPGEEATPTEEEVRDVWAEPEDASDKGAS